MEENVVSKIKDLDSDTLDDYVEEYEGNACTGKYHLGDNLLPYHFSDAIFLHDNAYHYPDCNEDRKIKTKIHNVINNEGMAVLFLVLGSFAPFISSVLIGEHIASSLYNDAAWVSVLTSMVLGILFFILFLKLCMTASKEIDLFSLTALNPGKTHRLKNIPMVRLDKNMPWKITAVHSRFSSTVEDLLDSTPQALSNAGWDLLISAYENYTSLYVFLAEKNGIISDELMDSYSTKLEKRYKKFSSIAQDVLNTAQKYQLYLDKEKQHSTQIQQDMLDGDALRAIPLEEDIP